MRFGGAGRTRSDGPPPMIGNPADNLHLHQHQHHNITNTAAAHDDSLPPPVPSKQDRILGTSSTTTTTNPHNTANTQFPGTHAAEEVISSSLSAYSPHGFSTFLHTGDDRQSRLAILRTRSSETLSTTSAQSPPLLTGTGTSPRVYWSPDDFSYQQQLQQAAAEPSAFARPHRRQTSHNYPGTPLSTTSSTNYVTAHTLPSSVRDSAQYTGAPTIFDPVPAVTSGPTAAPLPPLPSDASADPMSTSTFRDDVRRSKTFSAASLKPSGSKRPRKLDLAQLFHPQARAASNGGGSNHSGVSPSRAGPESSGDLPFLTPPTSGTTPASSGGTLRRPKTSGGTSEKPLAALKPLSSKKELLGGDVFDPKTNVRRPPKGIQNWFDAWVSDEEGDGEDDVGEEDEEEGEGAEEQGVRVTHELPADEVVLADESPPPAYEGVTRGMTNRSTGSNNTSASTSSGDHKGSISSSTAHEHSAQHSMTSTEDDQPTDLYYDSTFTGRNRSLASLHSSTLGSLPPSAALPPPSRPAHSLRSYSHESLYSVAARDASLSAARQPAGLPPHYQRHHHHNSSRMLSINTTTTTTSSSSGGAAGAREKPLPMPPGVTLGGEGTSPSSSTGSYSQHHHPQPPLHPSSRASSFYHHQPSYQPSHSRQHTTSHASHRTTDSSLLSSAAYSEVHTPADDHPARDAAAVASHLMAVTEEEMLFLDLMRRKRAAMQQASFHEGYHMALGMRRESDLSSSAAARSSHHQHTARTSSVALSPLEMPSGQHVHHFAPQPQQPQPPAPRRGPRSYTVSSPTVAHFSPTTGPHAEDAPELTALRRQLSALRKEDVDNALKMERFLAMQAPPHLVAMHPAELAQLQPTPAELEGSAPPVLPSPVQVRGAGILADEYEASPVMETAVSMSLPMGVRARATTTTAAGASGVSSRRQSARTVGTGASGPPSPVLEEASMAEELEELRRLAREGNFVAAETKNSATTTTTTATAANTTTPPPVNDDAEADLLPRPSLDARVVMRDDPRRVPLELQLAAQMLGGGHPDSGDAAGTPAPDGRTSSTTSLPTLSSTTTKPSTPTIKTPTSDLASLPSQNPAVPSKDNHNSDDDGRRTLKSKPSSSYLTLSLDDALDSQKNDELSPSSHQRRASDASFISRQDSTKHLAHLRTATEGAGTGGGLAAMAAARRGGVSG